MATNINISFKPPKKKTENTSTILKLKRYTSTFILTIEPSHSLEDIKYQLCNIINNSGGLPAIQDLEVKNEDEEDIAVPKSEYIDDVDEIKEEVQDESAIAKVLVDDIRVAYPKDSTQPYSNNWIELSEDSDIAELSLKDFDILAFAYGSEEQIEIVEPAYEEN